MMPTPEEKAKKGGPDDLDRLAATRIVIVREWPKLDGSDDWDCAVDYPNEMSPFEAHGVLQHGMWKLQGGGDE